MDVLELLRSSEGKTLEFKRDISSPSGVMKTLVAFANTAGGILLIGVADKTREVVGVKNSLDLEERLANLISDSITPRLVPDIEILPWRSENLVAVRVYPSGDRPHQLLREGTEEGVYIRVGSTNRRADASMIESMRRSTAPGSYDEQAMPDLNSEEIDFRAASELFAPIRSLKRRDLESLRLVTSHQGKEVPTIGGILLFGRHRDRHFPDAWIQAGRFKGADKTAILDQVEIRTHLPQAIAEAIAFVQKHSLHSMEFSSVRRVDRWTLPPTAVREAIINAVAHADYAQRGAPIRLSIFSDRLEVENPGLLPFGLTVDDLLRGISKLRNRVIGRVFHELGLVEQWGSGIQRILTTCRDAGLREPQFEEIATRFRVTLYSDRTTKPAVDDKDQAILGVLARAADDGSSTQELAHAIGLSPRTIRTRLAKLADRGLVREIGTSPQDPKRRYYVSR